MASAPFAYSLLLLLQLIKTLFLKNSSSPQIKIHDPYKTQKIDLGPLDALSTHKSRAASKWSLILQPLSHSALALSPRNRPIDYTAFLRDPLSFIHQKICIENRSILSLIKTYLLKRAITRPQSGVHHHGIRNFSFKLF